MRIGKMFGVICVCCVYVFGVVRYKSSPFILLKHENNIFSHYFLKLNIKEQTYFQPISQNIIKCSIYPVGS